MNHFNAIPACVTHVNLVNESRSYAQATIDCRASVGSRELFTMTAANVVCQSLVAKLTCKTNHAIQRPRHVSSVLGIECAVQSCAFPPSAAFRNGERTMCLPKHVSLLLCQRNQPALATTSGRRTQGSPCRANVNAASAVLELPKDIEVPKEVAAIFQTLQNGSDIRGVAIAGKSILESTSSFQLLLATRQSGSCIIMQVLRGRSKISHPR